MWTSYLPIARCVTGAVPPHQPLTVCQGAVCHPLTDVVFVYSVSRNARSRVVHVTLLGPTHWRSGCYRCCSTLCACAERWSNALSTCGVLLSIFTSLSTAVCQPEYITSLWSLFTSFHIPAVYSRVYSSVYSRVYLSVYSRVYSSLSIQWSTM